MSASERIRRLERVIRRPRGVNIAFYLARNLRARHAARLDSHRQSKGKPAGESVDYVERTFRELLRKASLDAGVFDGARVLELGPGDNFGLAHRFIAAGAEQVVALDKFAIRRDPSVEAAIYSELLRRLTPAERARFDPARLQVVERVGVEEAAGTFEPGSFDLITSVAVLEHVRDLDGAFASMDRLLRPGGHMLHEIDFRDHRMFTAGGGHPLEFLTVGPRLWRWMTLHAGGPNRVLIDYYRRKLRELGYDARLVVENGVSEEDGQAHDVLREPLPVTALQCELIADIRSRLRPPFDSLEDADLAAAGAFLAARKPG